MTHNSDASKLLITLAACCVVFALDQGTKGLVQQWLSDGRSVPVFGGLITLDDTHNTGSAFGLFRSEGPVFVLVALAAVMVTVVLYRRLASADWIVRLCVGMILGGALSNALDRVRLGYVVDFVDLRWWPVFNLADSAIVVGALLLAIASSTTSRVGSG